MGGSKYFASLLLKLIYVMYCLMTTPRINSEADLIGVLAHDLDCDQRSLGDLLTGIPTIGEDALNEREDAPRGL